MKKKMTFLSLILFLFTVFVSNTNHGQLKNTTLVQAEQVERNRVYVFLGFDWVGNNDLYLSYFGSPIDSTITGTRINPGLDDGLFFFDVPTAASHFVIRTVTDGWDGGRQTNDIYMYDIFNNPTFKIIKVNYGGEDWAKRPDEKLPSTQLDSLPEVAAAILSYIETCSDSNVNGYNAWPQLEALFFNENTFSILDNNNTVVKDFDNFGVVEGLRTSNTTLGEKLVELKNQYHIHNNGSSGLINNPISSDNSLVATIIIGVIGITTLAGYYFITKKSGLKV